MDQSEESTYGHWPTTHQYPDPDYAAHITTYPWGGGETDYVQPYLPDEHGGSQGSSVSGSSAGSCMRMSEHIEDFAGLPTVGDEVDPDYQMSADIVPEDENLSDEDSLDSADGLEGFTNLAGQQDSTSRPYRRRSGAGRARTRGIGRRGRKSGLGRGGRGIKRGPRKAIEPTEEFKALHSRATIAFIDQKYEEAEQLVLEAILINPEMYPAHNLLSQIYSAVGDEDKAICAAWAGAHTKHRDPEIWSRTASLILGRNGDDRESTLRGAIYCTNRIITLDKHNVEARYQRARLYHELGHNGKASVEYEELLKQLPYDTTVLRHLAEVCIELEKPERALSQYLSSIAHFRTAEPNEVSAFTWSDVNIVTELYGFQGQYDEGLTQLKSLARWLLGRGDETCWEAFDKDDREWDLDDRPRRIELPDFVPGKHDISTYGDGLPLELRIKLGIFRLRAPRQDLEEAINHFEWLDPEDYQAGAKLYDYADLFRETASALRRLNYFHEALRYYEPLQQVSDYADSFFLSELASCYRETGLKAEAEDCYKQIIDSDIGNYEARAQITALRLNTRAEQQGPIDGHQRISSRQHKSRRLVGQNDAKHSKTTGPPEASGTSMLQDPLPMQQGAKWLAAQRTQVEEEEIRSLFSRRQSLGGIAQEGSQDCKIEWMAATKSLLEAFRNNKVFYPFERHHRFYGYSKEARAMALRPKHELDEMLSRSQSIFETPDGDPLVVPVKFCDIPFGSWLDMFLEYGLVLAKGGDVTAAYEIIASAYHANVFYHSRDSLLSIHVCWFTCALIVNDDETLCNLARWFMKEYQFMTDGYRLFSALNRLCDSENSWYNCGPSQKYILRQLKAVDFSLLGENRRKNQPQERASYSTRDSDGQKICAKDMDVALLMLYGHILHAGRSYAYAVNYYLRALALDSKNSMIKLSLALGYMHYALKRQAENRHRILMQGIAFLLEYYDDRGHSNIISEQQEAEYNVAHAYHLLGLTHLAVPYYERCLHLSHTVQTDSINHRAEDFVLEAAINLQGYWAASGDSSKACEITEKWMVM